MNILKLWYWQYFFLIAPLFIIEGILTEKYLSIF